MYNTMFPVMLEARGSSEILVLFRLLEECGLNIQHQKNLVSHNYQ